MGSVVTDVPLSWRYEALERAFVCSIDGGPLAVQVVLECYGIVFPDVLEVERWMECQTSSPTTVEHLSAKAARRWKVKATAVGRSPTHGVIKAACDPADTFPPR